MPYELKKVNGGFQVASDDHPEGHSKHPMTKENATKQMLAMQMSEEGSRKFSDFKAQNNKGPGEM